MPDRGGLENFVSIGLGMGRGGLAKMLADNMFRKKRENEKKKQAIKANKLRI